MSKRMLLDGNHAAAWAARLAKAQVIPIYPITPQTECCTQLSEFVEHGEMPWASYITPESEHTVMGIACGASAGGARVFTSSAAQGVVHMEENIWIAAGNRLPIVMCIVNRAIANPGSLRPDLNDSLLQRDAGWIQLYCEDAQDALDTGIQMFKICEDERVYLPGIFAFEGYVVGHCAMPVELPDPEEVDDFLPPYKHKFVSLDPELRKYTTTTTPRRGEFGTERVYQMQVAMENAKKVIKEVNEDYAKRFGRKYGNGLLEKYRCEDADGLLITMGSITGTARKIVDDLREEGESIGLVKLRSFRPFPTEDLREAVKGAKAIGFVDRNRSPGSSGGGIGRIETANALYALQEKPLLLSFFVGLVGRDVMPSDVRFMAEKVLKAAETGKVEKDTYWVQLKGEEI